MEYYNNKLCVTFDELVSTESGAPVISRKALSMMLYRNPNLRVSRGGGLDRYARIDYYALRESYRKRFEVKYGDPSKMLREMQLKEELKVKIDNEARDWYENYRYVKNGEMKPLTDKMINEYTINASVLNPARDIQTVATRQHLRHVGDSRQRIRAHARCVQSHPSRQYGASTGQDGRLQA